MTAPLLRTLIDAPALRALVDAGTPPVIVDTGFDLADPAAGERQFAEGHLPGAAYWHLDRDLSGAKTGRNGRHPLPLRCDFGWTAARAGIAPGIPVVLYDRQGGPYAARAWWLLRWIGHVDAAVLDGGVAAWIAAGGALDRSGPHHASKPEYPKREPLVRTVDAAALAGRLGRTPLIDARAPERFRGEAETIDPVAGHIPGALNRFFKDNLDTAGRFRPAAELRDAWRPLAGADASQVVHACGSGVTACHNLLAMEHAGLTGSMLYPGSWSEWVSDPARPVATG